MHVILRVVCIFTHFHTHTHTYDLRQRTRPLMSVLSPMSGIQVSFVYHPHIHIKDQIPLCVCLTKPVAVELRCHATALISSPERKAHRWAYSIYRHPASVRRPSVVRQHFQTTYPLKPWGRFFPYSTYSIYRKRERKVVFFILVG